MLKQQSGKEKHILWCHVKQSWVSPLLLLLLSCVTWASYSMSLSLNFLISVMRIMPKLIGVVGRTEKVCVEGSAGCLGQFKS